MVSCRYSLLSAGVCRKCAVPFSPQKSLKIHRKSQKITTNSHTHTPSQPQLQRACKPLVDNCICVSILYLPSFVLRFGYPIFYYISFFYFYLFSMSIIPIPIVPVPLCNVIQNLPGPNFPHLPQQACAHTQLFQLLLDPLPIHHVGCLGPVCQGWMAEETGQGLQWWPDARDVS